MTTEEADAKREAVRPARGQLRFRFRFNPHLLVLLAGLAAAALLAFRAVESGIHVIYGSTYRQVDWRMDEARPNDGSPYVTGTLVETGEEYLVRARLDDQRFLIGLEGDETFEPGKVAKLWWSPKAPDIVLQNRRTNAIPVAAMPERPGVGSLALYTLGVLAVLAVTLKLTVWVASRWSRRGAMTTRW